MSHVVIRSVPFATRLTHQGAKDILTRDRARAQKLLAGIQPHGPAGFHEVRNRRHHRGDSAAVRTEPVSEGGSAASSPESIDVTDAGMSNRRVRSSASLYFMGRGHLHSTCGRWIASYPVYTFD